MTDSRDTNAHQLLEIKGGSFEDFTPTIQSFKKDRGVHFILAFSGGADDENQTLSRLIAKLKSNIDVTTMNPKQIDNLVAEAKEEYIADIVSGILRPLRKSPTAVLTGGTVWGVPSIATRVAKELGFVTIGVFPQKAMLKKQALPDELLDLAVCVHPLVGVSEWGDESPIYTKLLDAVVIIGGGAGTMVEVAHLLKLNEGSGTKRHLVPMNGTGGTADRVFSFPGKPKTMSECTPPHPINDVSSALEYLKQKAFIEDLYESSEAEESEE